MFSLIWRLIIRYLNLRNDLVLDQRSSKDFQNLVVHAQFYQSAGFKITVNVDEQPETFMDMFRNRTPIKPKLFQEMLFQPNGFKLANLGVSIALEVVSPTGEVYAAFTRRGVSGETLALISGYWDAHRDKKPSLCAVRELLEEFLVCDESESEKKFLIPQGFDFPYKANWEYSERWTLSANVEALNWVQSAKGMVIGDNSCRIYFDSTTSSGQLVFGYRAILRDWKDLSLLHAEDEPKGKILITYLHDPIVLFRLDKSKRHLVGEPLTLLNGKLLRVELPKNSYFHQSMVGVDSYAIVHTHRINLHEVVKS
ncbi:hypothetical protein WA1_48480 [Scytonema hofmannii PCC 7110]|uniref:Uncharacterized protein n=2 Tax=Scytonema hofmannii TaxID=34078 RepID=A0A139WTX6_9CYAN|nr:hypothetical protein WA1_48480 [Scytonema hofmannii PCC 7110]